MRSYTARLMLLTVLMFLIIPMTAFADDKPEITHHTIQYLDKALSLNIQWQSDNPVTRIRIYAGKGEKEIKIDEHDNRRNPKGYEGETSTIIPVEASLFQDGVPYQIQIEDDIRLKSEVLSGVVKLPPSAFSPLGASGGGHATGTDNWGKDNIQAGKGQGQAAGGKPNDMIDKLIQVAERFDTPPSLDVIKPNVLGPENVSFTSKANDDKGLKEISFRVYDSVGNKVAESVLNNLGKKWEGSTQPVKVTSAGNFRVVAQAVDSAGNTSKEQVATFSMKGPAPASTLLVSIIPQEAANAGGQWQVDGGAWQAAGASVPLIAGNHKVVFKEIAGWTVPAPQDVDVKPGENKISGTYGQQQAVVRQGSLQVAILPPEVLKAGGQWQVDGGAWQNDSAVLPLPIGKHRVAFKEVAGWNTPTAQDIDVKEGDNKLSGTYTSGSPVTPVPVTSGLPVNGTLSVEIVPAAAAGQWQADGGAWQASSASLSLPVGKHRITFKDIPGWSTPSAQDVEIKEGINKATGTYGVQNGTISVSILPASAAGAGAQWRVGSGSWQNSGASATVSAGPVSVEFKDVTGWSKPANLSLTVETGKTASGAAAYSRIYTVNKDFEEGVLVGLEDQTVKDQLQLTKTATTLPFLWVPNSNDGTISKVDTATGNELGRYFTGPSASGSPSRTTVDLKGNCWVGNRNTGTVVKVGLSENGQCLDRNGNGKIETSAGSTPLPWGQDECVLYEVNLNKGSEKTCTPGENCGKNSSGPRGIAIDASNNLWAGTYNTSMYYHIDGNSGAILKKIDLSSIWHSAYGAVVDKQGTVWSADMGGSVVRINPSTGTFTKVNLGHPAYGMGMDKNGQLYVAGWCNNKLSRVDTVSGTVVWSKSTGDNCSRGVAVSNDGDVWVVNSSSNSVSRWSNTGNKKQVVGGFNHPTGIATAADGKLWVVDYGSSNIYRLNPDTGVKEMEKGIGGHHYGYSDMTGIVARSMTTRTGTWTFNHDVVEDTVIADAVAWNAATPQGTSVKVKVRSSKDKNNWSAWEDAVSGTPLKSTAGGRYIQVESTVQVTSGEASPILNDLTLKFRKK